MPAEPVCLVCRRPLDPEPDDLAVSLDGPAFVEAVRQLRAELPEQDQAAARVLAEASAGLCRACGRPR